MVDGAGGDAGSGELGRLFRFECPEEFAKMPRVPGGYFCAQCRKTVRDLSELTPAEALSVVRDATAETCVSYAVNDKQELLFRGVRHGRVVVALATFLAACQAPPADRSPSPPVADPPQGTASAQRRAPEAADPPRQVEKPEEEPACETLDGPIKRARRIGGGLDDPMHEGLSPPSNEASPPARPPQSEDRRPLRTGGKPIQYSYGPDDPMRDSL